MTILLRIPVITFFTRTSCEKPKKHEKREPGLSKEEFRCTECCVAVAKRSVPMMQSRTSCNSVAKD